MNTILAAIRSIVLGATVLVAGVSVTRSSLTGFKVRGQVGLDAVETAQVIEAAIVAVNADSRPGIASTARKTSLRSQIIDGVHGICGVRITMRNSPLMGGTERVIVGCSAGVGRSYGEHQDAARRVARALRLEGLNAVVEGSSVEVLAA